jgi:hypothetical protein
MKLNLNFRNICPSIVLLFTITVFVQCKGSKSPNNKDTISKLTKASDAVTRTADSIKLTKLVKALYKWHTKDTVCKCGFNPLKKNASDTLYSGIDLDDNKKTISELRQTGFFAEDFLDNYRKIAVRMDKELRDGTSLWPEGELSTFGDDSDAWCNCQDYPVDDYWKIIRLTDIKYNENEASFKWTWGDSTYYKVKAKKEDSNWKISYLQGFDMNAYSWEWWKKNKK